MLYDMFWLIDIFVILSNNGAQVLICETMLELGSLT